jgi:hypothetical protein
MSNAIGVLLLTWNQGFYRYHGSFDFIELEQCLKKNWQKIVSFRTRKILSLKESDKETIGFLFNKILEALRGGKTGRKSPVGVAKALHLLAPNFFPLWDTGIAKSYKFYWYNPEKAAEKYMAFCQEMKELSSKVQTYSDNPKDVTLLKLIDEYNYAKYTKGWINGC